MASGKIAGLECCLAFTSLLTLPLIWVLVNYGAGVPGIGYSFIVSYTVLSLSRALFSWRIAGLSLKRWMMEAVVPVVVVVLIMALAGWSVILNLRPCFIRVLITSFACLCGGILSGWFFLLRSDERLRVSGVIRKAVEKLQRARYERE